MSLSNDATLSNGTVKRRKSKPEKQNSASSEDSVVVGSEPNDAIDEDSPVSGASDVQVEEQNANLSSTQIQNREMVAQAIQETSAAQIQSQETLAETMHDKSADHPDKLVTYASEHDDDPRAKLGEGSWTLAEACAEVCAEAMNNVLDIYESDIQFDVNKASSPQVGILWGDLDHESVTSLLERHDVTISMSIELPQNDRFLFIAERSESFLKEFQCGSVAAELEALRIDCRRAFALQTQHRRLKYWMWPLHNAKFNRQLLVKAFTGDSAHHVELTWRNGCHELVSRAMTWLGLKFGDGDLLAIIQSHFGTDVAITFLFTLHYITTLWWLGCFCLIFHIIKANVPMEDYRKIWSPILQFGVLFPWSLIFIVRWRARVRAVSKTWMADMLAEDVEVYTEMNPHFQPWDPGEDATFYPNGMRAMRTLLIVPLLLLDIALMCTVLMFVFWAEMWIVFEWGKCAEINQKNRNTECRGADKEHGFLGTLVEAIPGLVEGILFELLLAISKALARFAVKIQNWQTVTQQKLAYITQLIFFEFISKFGWIGVLAFIFVPDWGPVSNSQKRDVRYDEAKCDPHVMEYLDTRFMSMFDAADQSLSCLKTRTRYESRLLLFETAVAAPFFVAQIVSMCIKTIVPSLVVRFRACFPNDHGSKNGCSCSWCRALLRFLSCICLFDIESMGIDECTYLSKGDLIGEEIYEICCDRVAKAADDGGLDEACDAEQSVNNATELEEERSEKLLMTWAEGIREAFSPLDENLEVGMHFFWLISFTAFYPLGVVLALFVYLFDIRGDLVRLTIIQKRNWRNDPKATLVMLAFFVRAAIFFSIIFNVIVLFFTYMQMSRWSDDEKYSQENGLWNYLGELMALTCFCAIILLIVLRCVLHFSHIEEETELDATNKQSRVRVSQTSGRWGKSVRDTLKATLSRNSKDSASKSTSKEKE